MLTFDEICAVVSRVSYKNWDFHVVRGNDRYYLQLKWRTNDNYREGEYDSYSRKWLLSPHKSPSEIVQTCLKAVLTAEEHEARELFKYRGRPIFGPHFDVEQLVANFDERLLAQRQRVAEVELSNM